MEAKLSWKTQLIFTIKTTSQKFFDDSARMTRMSIKQYAETYSVPVVLLAQCQHLTYNEAGSLVFEM